MFSAHLVDDVGRMLRSSTPLRDNPIGIEDASLLTRLVGWVGGVGVDTEKTKPLTDGVVLGPLRREGREITCAGVAVLDTPAQVWALERHISGMFAGGMGVLETSQEDHTGSVYSLSAAVQLDGTIKVDTFVEPQPVVEWEIPLIAPDPCLYGPARTHTLTMTAEGVGLRFPWFAPADAGFLEFGAPAHRPPLLVNAGNAPAWPVYVVRGDLPQGFTIEQAGRIVSFGEAVFAASPVTVDMSGRVLVAGVDRTSAATVREWSAVPPGGTVVPTLTVPVGVASAQVTVRDTWM